MLWEEATRQETKKEEEEEGIIYSVVDLEGVTSLGLHITFLRAVLQEDNKISTQKSIYFSSLLLSLFYYLYYIIIMNNR